MTVEVDERGRLYLASDVRERHGEKFHLVEYQNRVELLPVDDDPLEGLRAAVGDAFEGESVEELRDRARTKAKQEAREDVRRD